MKNNTIGPVLSDVDFYSALRSEVLESKTNKENQEQFFEYIKTNLDKKTYFSAIDFDPSYEPDLLTQKQAEEALSLNMVSCGVYHRFEGQVDWYSNHTYNNYEEWTWQLSRHRQILDLSHRYTAAIWLTIEMNGLYSLSLLYPFSKEAKLGVSLPKTHL